MSLERQAIAGLKWSAAGKLASQVFSWAVTLVVLRILSPGDYGLVALSSMLITTIGSIAEAGLGASIVQARDVSRAELARITGTLVTVNGTGVAVLLVTAPLVADLFAAPQLTDVLRVCALQFVLNAIDAVPQSIATREMKFRWLSTLELGTVVVSSTTTLGLAWAGTGVWSLVGGTLVGGAVRSAFLVTQGTAVWPKFALTGMSRHFRFGGAVTIGRVLWQLAHQFDVMIAGRALGKEAVGVYIVVMQLATLPMQKAMAIVNQVAFPAVSRLQDDLPRLRERLIEAVRLLFFASVPALWGISAVAPEIVELLLDQRWRAATLPLQLAALIAPIRMLAALLSTATAGVGRADFDLHNSITTFIVFPVAFAAGVHWGLDGLSVSWIAAVLVVFVLNWPRTRAALGIESARFAVAARAPLVAGIVMYTAVWGLRLAADDAPTWMRLPLLVAAGAAVYLALAFLLDRGLWRDVRRFAAATR